MSEPPVQEGPTCPPCKSVKPMRPVPCMPQGAFFNKCNMGLLGKPQLMKGFVRRQTTPVIDAISQMKSLAEEIQEIPGLLAKVDISFGKTFVPCDAKVRPTCDYTREVGECLRKIERILERPNAFECLNAKTERQVLWKVSKLLFRKCSEIPKKYIFCDQRVALAVLERDVYVAMYHILEKTIKCGDAERLREWATNRVIRDFIQCWDTPDELEQVAVETAINALCDRLSEKKKEVYDIIMEKLEDCDESRYTLVAAAIKWLVNLHRHDVSITPDLEVFKKSILPLFRSPHLPVFSKCLDCLASTFYGYFEELPVLVAEYLFKHWPVTDSNKGSCYVLHLATIVRTMGTDPLAKLAEQVCKQIGVCVTSPNFNVSLAALTLLTDRMFISHFAEVGPRVFPMVYRSIQCHVHDWHKDVESSASVAMSALVASCPECQNTPEEVEDKSKDEDVRQQWMSIFVSVADDHPEFQQESFEKGLSVSICYE